jgi:hypothetical protein
VGDSRPRSLEVLEGTRTALPWSRSASMPCSGPVLRKADVPWEGRPRSAAIEADKIEWEDEVTHPLLALHPEIRGPRRRWVLTRKEDPFGKCRVSVHPLTALSARAEPHIRGSMPCGEFKVCWGPLRVLRTFVRSSYNTYRCYFGIMSAMARNPVPRSIKGRGACT